MKIFAVLDLFDVTESIHITKEKACQHIKDIGKEYDDEEDFKIREFEVDFPIQSIDFFKEDSWRAAEAVQRAKILQLENKRRDILAEAEKLLKEIRREQHAMNVLKGKRGTY